jgi:predicted metal-dependent phosphoesterase TrpH
VLGYFIETASAPLQAFLEGQRADRLRRVTDIRDRLADLGRPIDADVILENAQRGRSVGRSQIADALLEAGHVGTRAEAFERFLAAGGPAYVPRMGANAAKVIRLIHEAGGIASLAHPGTSGRDHLIPGLAATGLDAIEARHADHDADTEARYRRLADILRLVVSGGSDFHGETAAHRAAKLGVITLPLEDFERLRRAARGAH